MKNSIKKSALGLLIVASLYSCKDKTVDVIDETGIQVPSTYSFESRFKKGESSVVYSGQVVRNLLIQDIKNIISAHASGSETYTKQDVLDRFNHLDEKNTPILTKVGTAYKLKTSKYNEISTGKNLSGKLFTTSLYSLGNKTASTVLTDYINSLDFSKTGTDFYVSSEYIDYNEMINKILISSLQFYQATSVYLSDSKLYGADNSKVDGTNAYTSMEHTWDESFGYFGSAKDYFNYTDSDLSNSSMSGGKYSYAKDTNNDTYIDFTSEFNIGFSITAAKRDIGGNVETDFTKDLFDAYLKGRTAITNQKGTLEIEPHRASIIKNLEKVIAATTIHYINETIEDLSYIGRASSHPSYTSGWGTGEDAELYLKKKLLAKHWSELKGYSVAFECNTTNVKTVNTTDLQYIADNIGLKPVADAHTTDANKNYITALTNVRTKLKTLYGFSDASVSKW